MAVYRRHQLYELAVSPRPQRPIYVSTRKRAKRRRGGNQRPEDKRGQPEPARAGERPPLGTFPAPRTAAWLHLFVFYWLSSTSTTNFQLSLSHLQEELGAQVNLLKSVSCVKKTDMQRIKSFSFLSFFVLPVSHSCILTHLTLSF